MSQRTRRSPWGRSPTLLDQAQAIVRKVEKERRKPVTSEDVQRIIEDLQSHDPNARARALREICPCRMSWEVYSKLAGHADRLKADPNPVVRSMARHLDDDARLIERAEAMTDWLADQERARERRRAKARRSRR